MANYAMNKVKAIKGKITSLFKKGKSKAKAKDEEAKAKDEEKKSKGGQPKDEKPSDERPKLSIAVLEFGSDGEIRPRPSTPPGQLQLEEGGPMGSGGEASPRPIGQAVATAADAATAESEEKNKE